MKRIENGFVMRKPDNWHNHLRYGELLRALLIYTIRQFRRSSAMGNLKEMPIVNAMLARQYRDEINALAAELGYPAFEVWVSMLLTPATTPKMIEEAVGSILALKVYPLKGTTNSDLGIPDFCAPAFYDQVRVAAVCKIPVQIHAEVPGDQFPQGFREAPCAPMICRLADAVPDAVIFIEHISTRAMRDVVLQYPGRMFATVTPHHLYETRDSALKDVHLCCMPFPASEDDRDSIKEVVLAGNPQFSYGSDNAPHKKEAKAKKNEQGDPDPAYGVCTAPVELAVMAQFFKENGRIELMEPFMSEFGAKAYGLPLNEETITLVEKEYEVPEEVAGVVPYRYGQTLSYQFIE